MFCLSKGLSCPLGSVLCGSRDFIARADRARKRLGGGMRQAGIIAAAGIVALETMVDRLAEDHQSAQRLARLLQDVPGLRVNLEEVETNMMYVDHTAANLPTAQVVALLERHGVLVSDRPPPPPRPGDHRGSPAKDSAGDGVDREAVIALGEARAANPNRRALSGIKSFGGTRGNKR
jgi:threonine aldolase